MLDKFNKFCDIILESGTELCEDVKPTCVYCGCDVPVERYLKQKESYESFTGVKNSFKPTSCHCEKCGEALSKMYSGGTKWTGD